MRYLATPNRIPCFSAPRKNAFSTVARTHLLTLSQTCSEDGCIILHDMRADSRYTRTQRILQHSSELTGLQYHPTMTNIFATSDNRGLVCLRDIRMAFGPLSQRRDEGIVHKVGPSQSVYALMGTHDSTST